MSESILIKVSNEIFSQGATREIKNLNDLLKDIQESKKKGDNVSYIILDSEKIKNLQRETSESDKNILVADYMGKYKDYTIVNFD